MSRNIIIMYNIVRLSPQGSFPVSYTLRSYANAARYRNIHICSEVYRFIATCAKSQKSCGIRDVVYRGDYKNYLLSFDAVRKEQFQARFCGEKIKLGGLGWAGHTQVLILLTEHFCTRYVIHNCPSRYVIYIPPDENRIIFT